MNSKFLKHRSTIIFCFVIVILGIMCSLQYIKHNCVQESFVPAINRTQNKISRNIRVTKDALKDQVGSIFRNTKRFIKRTTNINQLLK